MTIMILEVHAPESFTLEAMLSESVSILAFVVSFLGLTNLWVSHHSLFEQIKVVDKWTFVANMLLLLWVSLVPVTTAWVAEYPTKFLPQLVYISVEIGWAVLLFNLNWQAKRVNPEINTMSLTRLRAVAGLSVLVIGAVLTPFLPYVTLAAGSFVAVYFLIWPISEI